MRLDNYPNDIEKFKWIVAKEGCHPKAANRILDRISINGYDLLTVMSRLNFEVLVKELSVVGVVVTFIEPLKGWTDKYKDGAWPEDLLNKIFKK